MEESIKSFTYNRNPWLTCEECLKKERDRVSHYLHSSTEPKLIEKVEHELLVVYVNQLLENENSGCAALFKEDKVEDLYQLYHKIPQGLELLENAFKEIPLPSAEERKVVKDVAVERKWATDAAIVRIMKSRKTLGYQQLVTECTEQVSKMFKPDIRTIKKRTDDLVAREFLERDQKDPSIFKYLA
ncbi:hypothetical protein COLO4_12767 [Corchorus olitorius]|uniref:Cullin neddylation domain-containing protein n=1 Tax=Corchorus olitorius TaxID=93759 RepID=A0A1R3JZP0_9ROSI|nr:hypothetical protein COLO4_12767 [Corchorus olitorius]